MSGFADADGVTAGPLQPPAIRAVHPSPCRPSRSARENASVQGWVAVAHRDPDPHYHRAAVARRAVARTAQRHVSGTPARGPPRCLGACAPPCATALARSVRSTGRAGSATGPLHLPRTCTGRSATLAPGTSRRERSRRRHGLFGRVNAAAFRASGESPARQASPLPSGPMRAGAIVTASMRGDRRHPATRHAGRAQAAEGQSVGALHIEPEAQRGTLTERRSIRGAKPATP
jgi:hypothetical protein